MYPPLICLLRLACMPPKHIALRVQKHGAERISNKLTRLRCHLLGQMNLRHLHRRAGIPDDALSSPSDLLVRGALRSNVVRYTARGGGICSSFLSRAGSRHSSLHPTWAPNPIGQGSTSRHSPSSPAYGLPIQSHPLRI